MRGYAGHIEPVGERIDACIDDAALGAGVHALARAVLSAAGVCARDTAVIRAVLFPADVRVISFADVPGWHLQVVTDSTHRVTGAVWTGTLPPQRFVELPFMAVNPKTESRLTWPTYQSYADGERVEWTGPEDARTPASSTMIQTQQAVSTNSGIPWLAGVAVVLALISLGLVLRRP